MTSFDQLDFESHSSLLNCLRVVATLGVEWVSHRSISRMLMLYTPYVLNTVLEVRASNILHTCTFVNLYQIIHYMLLMNLYQPWSI